MLNTVENIRVLRYYFIRRRFKIRP